MGVTVTVVEQVPALNVLTDVPLTLQIFADATATLITTFEDDAITIFAFVARQVREMSFPFLTEHFTVALETVVRVGKVVVGDGLFVGRVVVLNGAVDDVLGGIVVGGDVVVDVSQGVKPSLEDEPDSH